MMHIVTVCYGVSSMPPLLLKLTRSGFDDGLIGPVLSNRKDHAPPVFYGFRQSRLCQSRQPAAGVTLPRGKNPSAKLWLGD